MALPLVSVSRRTNPPPRSEPTDTGLAYVAGLADRGPANSVVEVRNLTQFISTYGARQTYSGLYDWLDTYFHEGGARALIARVVGPAAAKAKRNLLDGSATVSLVVEALYPGAYGNAFTVTVTRPDGTHYVIALSGTAGDGTTTITETSPSFTLLQEAVDWSASSALARITLGASGLLPAALAASVLGNTTSGADDRASITDTQWATARGLFVADYGPGQSIDVGRTTSAGHAALIAAANTKGRVAVLDFADTGSASTLLASAATDRAVANSHVAAAYAPWITIPPLPGATAARTVPASALAAAVMARNDGEGTSVNVPPAGGNGIARWATGLSQAPWTEGVGGERDQLNSAGVNVLLDRLNTGVTIFGARTIADPATDQWIWVSNARFFTAIVAQANLIGDQFVLGELNVQEVATFHAALAGMLLGYWPQDLVGDTPQDAFNVDTSENTDATMQAGQLKATLSLRIAGVSEQVQIDIVKVAITEAVA